MSYVALSKSQNLVLLSVLLLALQLLISVQSQFLFNICDTVGGNFTVNGTYEVNLKSLISSLPSLPQNEDGFYNVSVGKSENGKVNSLMMCRGDVKPVDCIKCIVAAGQDIRKKCPNQIEANLWHDKCMFRYSNRTILNTMDTTHGFSLATNFDFPGEKDAWDKMLTSFLESLRSIAAAGGNKKKFAVSKTSGPLLQTLYGLMQCTPDISERDCFDCLSWQMGRITILCKLKMGCRLAALSCNLRFDTFRFYDPTSEEPIRATPPAYAYSPSHSPPFPQSNHTVGDNKAFVDQVKGLIIISALVIGGVIFVVGCCIAGFLKLREKRLRKKELRKKELRKKELIREKSEDKTRVDSLEIKLSDIKDATDNFSSENKLGEGGFGEVYEGLLKGRKIAVKRLSKNTNQGEKEFRNEVSVLSKLQHCNLVTLLGFSAQEGERILVYEFVPNASLDKFFSDPTKLEELDWGNRYKIILGVARGLVYLHVDSRPQIIHRDLKPGNILLGLDMTPKIADFGMAKLFDSQSHMSHISASRIVGTIGYMAPEYISEQEVSFKTDVYSFGVMVLEIVCGQTNSHFKHMETDEDLFTFVWRVRDPTTATELRPEQLNLRSFVMEQVITCMRVGLQCIHVDPDKRPNMDYIYKILDRHNRDYAPSPIRPRAMKRIHAIC